MKPALVYDPNINPNLTQDLLNAEKDINEQLPPSAPPARYIYDGDEASDVLADSSAYEYLEGGELLRCSTAKHPTVHHALRWFHDKRKALRWRYEYPMYRTARFWCRRVFFGGTDG